MQCINAWHEWPQYCKLFIVYAFWHAEESTWVTLNLADVQKRRDKLKVAPTHEKIWAALRWHENSQEERSWHMGRHETRWKELRCEVWRVRCAVWGRCLLDDALHQGRAQVMFLDSNTATASHKARTHGPGWRTAHASSLIVEGSLEVKLPTIWTVEKQRWEESEEKRSEERRCRCAKR